MFVNRKFFLCWIIVVICLFGGIASILAITFVVIFIFVVRAKCGSNSERMYDLPADYEKPMAPPVTVEATMEVNVAYEQVKSFDMNDNSAYISTNVASVNF
jgi:hypothetical protein